MRMLLIYDLVTTIKRDAPSANPFCKRHLIRWWMYHFGGWTKKVRIVSSVVLLLPLAICYEDLCQWAYNVCLFGVSLG